MKIPKGLPVFPKGVDKCKFCFVIGKTIITKDTYHLIEFHCESYHKINDHPWLIFYVNEIFYMLGLFTVASTIVGKWDVTLYLKEK